METHWAYCSACDRQVEVAIQPAGSRDPETGVLRDALVCLEVGHTCTGALCPITDVSPEKMREALDGLRASEPTSDKED